MCYLPLPCAPTVLPFTMLWQRGGPHKRTDRNSHPVLNFKPQTLNLFSLYTILPQVFCYSNRKWTNTEPIQLTKSWTAVLGRWSQTIISLTQASSLNGGKMGFKQKKNPHSWLRTRTSLPNSRSVTTYPKHSSKSSVFKTSF